MELKVIGTGSKGNSYALIGERETLLIEAGMNTKEVLRSLSFDLSKVAGCIITHSHKDHAGHAKTIANRGIDLYASKQTYKEIGITKNHRTKEIEAKKAFTVGGFRIMPFSVNHDVECLGFLIDHEECGRLLFITDTYYCRYKFNNLNNIVIEANYSDKIIDKKLKQQGFLRDRIIKSHFSLENCIELLKANDLSKVNNIVLIHLSDSNSDAELFKEEVQKAAGVNTTIAANDISIEISKDIF